MSAVNDDVYARVHDKAKEHNLTEQEIKVIERAREQLQKQTTMGGIAGASVAFFLGKAKKFNPIQILALAGGGFLMGSQMGLISGALTGVKAINSLPNPERLINIIREAQMEAMKMRQENGPARVKANPMTPAELHNVQNPQDQFSPEVTEFQNNDGAASLWNKGGSAVNDTMSEGHSDPYSQPQRPVQSPQTSAWDKIRSGNLPNSTWSKIRTESMQHPESDEERLKDKAERLNRLREYSELSGEELPRTREEAAHRGPTRKNQWGDSLE